MNLKKHVVAFVVLGFSFHSIESFAWVQTKCRFGVNDNKPEHWPATKTEYKPVIDPETILTGSSLHTAVVDALASMNKNPSKLRYTYGGMDNGDGVKELNGESEISYTDLGSDDLTTIAVTTNNSDDSPNCETTESDIRINSNYRKARPPVGINKLTLGNSKRP
jgi:hypothetical protein